jgi:D-ribose pyranase
LETLKTVLQEMQVERIILADETSRVSPHIQAAIQELLPNTPVQTVSHQELKDLTRDARAVVRTGEFTPYANVVLVSGVVF